MHVINVNNVTEALFLGLEWLRVAGVPERSRNGTVLVSPTPVTTVYRRPWERVLISPLRDANPFFHLMESLWMLAGRDDVELPAYYAKHLASFSDDGVTLNGAYGHRWRNHFEHNQLSWIISELRRDPTTRRCVLGMWDPANDPFDATRGSKDVPCNTHIYFRASNGELDMTVCCRSNDVVWGACGANAVHFSILHEYIASMTGLFQGRYYQISNNFHTYVERPDVQRLYDSAGLPLEALNETPYPCNRVRLVDVGSQWDEDLRMFMEWWGLRNTRNAPPMANRFFSEVALPMVQAFDLYRHGMLNAAIVHLKDHCKADDWAIAGVQWLQRRLEKRNAG
jgi:hypothetical protein